MLHSNERIIKHKVGRLNPAQEPGNGGAGLPGHGSVAWYVLPRQARSAEDGWAGTDVNEMAFRTRVV